MSWRFQTKDELSKHGLATKECRFSKVFRRCKLVDCFDFSILIKMAVPTLFVEKRILSRAASGAIPHASELSFHNKILPNS
jgi:hypothetical protein